MSFDLKSINMSAITSSLPLPIKDIPYDISWQAGRYFLLTDSINKKGSFEMFFGKESKFKSIVRLTVFGCESNYLLKELKSPWLIGDEFKNDGIKNYKSGSCKIHIEENDSIVTSVDIIDADGIRENNGYYKSLLKFNKITECDNCNHVYDKLLGAWDLDENLTKKFTSDKLGVQYNFDGNIWERMIFFDDDKIKNMHIYRNSFDGNFKSKNSSRYYKIFKIISVKSKDEFTLSALDLKFGSIAKKKCKFEGDLLLVIDDTVEVWRRIGDHESFML